VLALTASVAYAAPPPISSPPPSTVTGAPRLRAKGAATPRERYKTAVETPTVAGRHNVPKLANYLADKFRRQDGRLPTCTCFPMRRSMIRRPRH
jgi:hypothetical protein